MMATYINNNGFTPTRAGYLDNINNSNLSTIVDISTLTATEIAKLTSLNVHAGVLYASSGEQVKTYPLLASGVDVDSSATAWNWGSYTEIVPASTITNDFELLGFIYEEGGVKSAIFEFAKGGAGSEVTVVQMPFAVGEKDGSGQKGQMLVLLPIKVLIEANSRVACRITDNQSSAITWDNVKIAYHEQ